MNAKTFCQRFGISQDDASWIMRKHKDFDGDAKDWFDLVAENLSFIIPHSLLEAIKPVELPLETKTSPKSKKAEDTETA